MPPAIQYGVDHAGAPASGDRRIDASFHLPLSARPWWVAMRAGALSVAAIVIALAPGVERRWEVVAILAVATALQPLLLRTGRGRDLSAAMGATDVLVAAAIAALVPGLYPAAALWIGTLVTWQAVTSPKRVAGPICAGGIVAFAVAGLLGGVDEWWMVTIVQAMLCAAYLVFGNALRVEVGESELDLLTTVSIGGAIVHQSSMAAGTAMQVHGDVEALTGYTREEWIGLDHLSILHPDDVDDFWIDIDRVRPNSIIDRVGRIRRPDGTWMWLRDVSRVTRDRSGHLTLRGFTLDVTATQESHAEMRRQARRDSMTGLPNRVALHESMSRRLEDGEPFATLLIDLNRFKEVNDTLGHEAGDHVIEVIADRLRDLLGEDDLLARIGGDEFAVLVAGATCWDDVSTVAGAIAEACRAPIVVRGVSVALSASTGVAFATKESDRATLLRHADIAMYAAKRSGSPSQVFDASLHQLSTEQLSLTAALQGAIERGEFELFFQPKFDLRTRALVGAEGLVRWRHPQHGLLTPDTFLEVVLMSESSADFVRSTVQQAVDMIGRTIALGHPLPIAVNVAIASIRDLAFADGLFDCLGQHGIPSELLTIEVTEHEVGLPSEDALDVLRRLRAGGVAISIDDFGTGHSSLARLRSLDVDELKLDRTFVGRLTDDERDRRIVRTIIDLADRLGLALVAEGVETEEQAADLLAMGCHVAQGFLFAPALDASEFERLVDATARRQRLDPLALPAKRPYGVGTLG